VIKIGLFKKSDLDRALVMLTSGRLKLVELDKMISLHAAEARSEDQKARHAMEDLTSAMHDYFENLMKADNLLRPIVRKIPPAMRSGEPRRLSLANQKLHRADLDKIREHIRNAKIACLQVHTSAKRLIKAIKLEESSSQSPYFLEKKNRY